MSLRAAVRLAVVFGIATFLVGCGNLFSSDCVSVGVSGIEESVVAAPNAAPLATTPRVTTQDGAYEEHATLSANFPPPLRFHGAIERLGTYTVIVHADGYVTHASTMCRSRAAATAVIWTRPGSPSRSFARP